MCAAFHVCPACLQFPSETEATALTDVSLDVINKLPLIDQFSQNGEAAMVSTKDTINMLRISGGDDALLTRLMVRCLCRRRSQEYIVSRCGIGEGHT